MTLFNLHFDFGNLAFPWFTNKPAVVLVVDDDANAIEIIRRSASAEGKLVEAASTAEEALGILHANGRRFVLAMIDVNLPSMDGWALRRRMKDLWPKLPVVIMSGAVESFRAMPAGERLSVLIKPPHYGDFFRTIPK